MPEGLPCAGKVRLAGIEEESIVDGPGIRYVIFTQGCPHHCKGCHNPQTHSYTGGFFLSPADILAQLGENPLLSGITLSGGEPFLQPEPLCSVARGVHDMGLNVVTYSGYTFEQLWQRATSDPWTRQLLDLTDILIDGPYVENLRNLELRFRGSLNQRLLDREERERILSQL